MPASTLTEATTVACLFFIFLVPLAAGGLALINVGLGRSRSAGHMMMASLCTLAVAGLAYFVCGFAWQGLHWRSRIQLRHFREGLELDCRGALLFSQTFLRRFRCFPRRVVSNLLRGPRGFDPAGKRRGPLASAGQLSFDGTDRRRDISALCALGLGRRVARATWRQLWNRPGVSGCGRRRHDSGPGRPHGSDGHLDSRAAAREIFRGRYGASDPRPQCEFWFCSVACWLSSGGLA